MTDKERLAELEQSLQDERITWNHGDVDYEPPPNKEGDEMSNPLDELPDLEDELDELEDEVVETEEFVEGEEPTDSEDSEEDSEDPTEPEAA